MPVPEYFLREQCRRQSVVLAGVWIAAFSLAASGDGVVINEIMYHAADSTLEYVEIFNSSAEPVDLSGWIFKDNRDTHLFTFPQRTILDGGGFLVIADDGKLFRAKYGFEADLTGFSFDLSNGGDAVRLFNPSGECVEAVAYDDRSPWPERADGEGASLERRNALLPPELPVSWAASRSGGTPGEPNSAHSENLQPVIVSVDHSPKIPAPGQAVRVTAHVFDVDGRLVSVTLHHGTNEGTTYLSQPMLDDGTHGDGIPGDSIYTAEIPVGSLYTIIRFYVTATDDEGLQSIHPDSGADTPNLTVVERPVSERVPVLRVVMRPEIHRRFLARYNTDEYFPATFYEDDNVYYSVHIRHRGRSRSPNSRFKIRFPHGQLYRGEIRRINLNGTDYSSLIQEFLSYSLYGAAGLPNLDAEIVRLHINGRPAKGIPYRVAIENPDAQFLRRRRFFRNDNGNLYKTTLDGTPQNKATWRYIGDDPWLYQGCYIKQTNEKEADWSDIIRFCKVLTESWTWDEDYVQKVRSVLNTDVFIKWMAVSALVAHWDSPFTDHGQNYVLYNNPDTGLFNIIVWDLNSTFRYSSNRQSNDYRKHYTHIRSTKFDAINKMLNSPIFGSEYYREIDRLMDTLFAQEAMEKRIEAARRDLKLTSNQVSYLRTYVSIRRRDLSKWINRDVGIAFLSKPVYQAMVGEPYMYRAVAVDYRNNRRISYRLQQAPAWVEAEEESGIVSGVPPQEGRYDVTITAVAPDGIQVTQSYKLQVTVPLPRLIMNFNERTGPALDLSPFGHKGTFSGNAKRVEGRLGSAVYLDGSGDYVRIPHSDDLNLTGEVTVEAWIRPDYVSTGNPIIITKGNADRFNYVLMLGYGPFSWDRMEPCFMPHPFGPQHRVFYGRKEIEARLRARRWYHVAGTYDSAREVVRVYCNNKRICESASRALMPENTSDLFIGLPGSRCFRGAVDDVRVLPFAKEAFAAGVCISRVDISGLSPAQDKICLSLSPHRSESVDTSDLAIYLPQSERWLPLPSATLAPGKTVWWWLDDLGLREPVPLSGTIALYPASTMGKSTRRTILDQVVWGDSAPSEHDPGVQAGIWRQGRSVVLSDEVPWTLSLRDPYDNDEMDEDWTVAPQEIEGPVIVSLAINAGATETDQTSVEISIIVQGKANKMRVSNSPDLGLEWAPYEPTKTWSLTPGEGQKKVYAQVLDESSGRRSPVAVATIRLVSSTNVDGWRMH